MVIMQMYVLVLEKYTLECLEYLGGNGVSHLQLALKGSEKRPIYVHTFIHTLTHCACVHTYMYICT